MNDLTLLDQLRAIDPVWLWAIGGLILLIAEVVAPGFFLLFIGGAALAAGVLALALDLGLMAQVMAFALFAALGIALGKTYYRRDPTSEPFLNDRAAQMIGRTVTVVEPVDPYGGRVKVGDSEWTARGGPAPAGAKVVVLAVEGNCLTVASDPALPDA